MPPVPLSTPSVHTQVTAILSETFSGDLKMKEKLKALTKFMKHKSAACPGSSGSCGRMEVGRMPGSSQKVQSG